jgi:hypothetical protein
MSCISSGTWGTVAVTVQHLDATLDHYPTETWYGSAIPVNRKIAALNSMRVFVPVSDVKVGRDGILGTADDGYLTTRDTVSDFDPNGISWLSNFGSNTESLLDNYLDYTLYYAAWWWDTMYRWSFPYDVNTRFDWPYGMITYRSGLWVVTPWANFYTRQDYVNYGWTDLTDVKLCEVIDANTYDTIADWGTYNDWNTIHVPWTPMYLWQNGWYTSGSFHYEYATTYESSWTPDASTQHQAQVAAECNGTGTVWYTDFNTALSHGSITKVRLIMDVPVSPNVTMYWWIAHQARSHSLTWMYLPGGTLLSHYGAFTDSVQWSSWWQWNSYMPNTYTGGHAWFGWDRLTLQHAKVRILKSATPLDNSGTPTWSPASSPW